MPDSRQFFGRILQFVEHGERFPLREMGVQQLYDLVVIRSHGSELGVQLRQFGYVFQRSAVRFLSHGTSSPKTRALIKAAFDSSPDRSYIVRKRACSVSLNRTMTQCEAVSVFAGRPPRPLRAGLFFSIIEIFEVRLLPRRLLKIAIRSWRSRLSKSADFGGAFIPLAGKLFPDAKNFLCSRKHSLLFALCKYVSSACRTDY